MLINLAIVGLGTVGTQFLQEVLKQRDNGIEVRCVAELEETEGKKLARSINVAIVSLDEIIAEKEAVDVIFDLTGSKKVRGYLREELGKSGNKHTVVVPETVARMMWSLMTNRPLPQPEDHSAGY
jgi:predicted dinucleotide-utilizing enzyme